MVHPFIRRYAVLGLLALLAPACGKRGGGGGSGTPAPPAVLLPIIALPGTTLVQVDRPSLATTTLTGPGLGDNSIALRGLDYDPLTGELLAISGEELVRIDPTTGAMTRVGSTGFCSLEGLAFDPTSRTLYASSIQRHLVSIDLTTGWATDIGPTGGPQLVGLAFDATGGILYGIEDPGTNLYTVNTSTGQATFLMNVPTGGGLAYDGNARLLYTFVTSTHQIAKIDPVAKTTTYVGGGSYGDLPGLAFIDSSNRLLGVNGSTLYEVNVATGVPTKIVQIGVSGASDIAYDPALNLFYGVSGSILCSYTPSGAISRIGPTGISATGIAFDPGPRILYATDASNLFTLDVTTGASTLIGSIGFANVMDLAFDSGSGKLYGSVAAGQLITINGSTGAGTLIGNHGVIGLDAIAVNPSTGTLYGISTYYDNLYTLNTSTAAATLVGPLGASGVGALDFSTAETILYGIGAPGQMVRINPGTGLASSINSLGQILDGLAWDPDGQILYGLGSYSKPRLFRIDTTTWQATYVAPVNTTYVYYGSFTYDRDRATLWGIDINRRLIRIDPATGAVTDTGPTGIFPSALAYHPVLHRLFAVDLAGSDHLYELNVSTGAGTLVGAIGFTDLAGLTFDPSTGLLLSCDTATDQFVQIDPLSGAGVALGRARCCVSALTVPY